MDRRQRQLGRRLSATEVSERGDLVPGLILRRLLLMIPSFFAVSVVAFTIIQLPPGDFVTSYAADLATSGTPPDQAKLDALRVRYGLDQSLVAQYFTWIGNALQGDLGMSFEYRAPV